MHDWKMQDQKMQDWNMQDRKMQDWKMQDRKMQDKTFSIFGVKLCLLYRDLIIISTSLYISIASEALMLRTCRLAHLCVCVCLSVCLSVCLESVLWQNG